MILDNSKSSNLIKDEVSNNNVTKVSVKWDKNNIGQAKEFFRYKNIIDENTFHHVGIYSYTINSIKDFVKLPSSKFDKR